jgi:hypothetical protein
MHGKFQWRAASSWSASHTLLPNFSTRLAEDPKNGFVSEKLEKKKLKR